MACLVIYWLHSSVYVKILGILRTPVLRKTFLTQGKQIRKRADKNINILIYGLESASDISKNSTECGLPVRVVSDVYGGGVPNNNPGQFRTILLFLLSLRLHPARLCVALLFV